MATKNQTIRNTFHQTRQRRQGQTCHVYELKVDKCSLSASGLESLQRLFHEARWFYNAVLASDNLFAFDARVRQVMIKTPDGWQPLGAVVETAPCADKSVVLKQERLCVSRGDPRL